MTPAFHRPSKRSAFIDAIAGARISPELVQQRIEELGEVARMKGDVDTVFVRVKRLSADAEEDSLVANLVWSVTVSGFS